ncbi:Verru_Chthon cassette protein A [Verrucomicrobiales bacterium]|nr:Verru_Chthon cassette protein A [Verrucomicrobiales bacterium]
MHLGRNTPSFPKRGAALITTLVVIALITVIVVSFLSMVGVAKRSSSYHGDAASLQNLRDSAVTLALAQIREGTTRDNEVWTSQPGVIRTFGESTGDPSRIYKLYSDDDMTVVASDSSSPEELNLVKDVPPGWDTAEGQYVDLNEPVASMTDKNLHFPIVDPRLYDGKSGDTSSTPEGFSYSKELEGKVVKGVLGPSDVSHPNDQRISMPVKWIYRLLDGSLGTLDSDGTFLPFRGENEASAENPISGRFAFWTDDESTKLNLNTASEAIPWDTPRCATPEDVGYAENPPVKNELQRFGGHPAATCLSSVFFPRRKLDPEKDLEIYEAIYDLVPRVNMGGILTGSKSAIAFDSDRLYANVDEALLKPSREENTLFQFAGPDLLQRSRFLLTATSRAPEVTAAGTPRVSLWPLYYKDDPSRRTAFDRLVDFSTTINNRPYHFRRNSPNTNIAEYNTTYSDQRTNADLLNYLLELVRTSKNGYPKSIAEKYDPTGLEHNSGTQVVSFLEMIRQINLHDNSIAASGNRIIPYAYYFRQPYFGGVWIGSEVYGQVTSIQSGSIPRPFGGNGGLLRGAEAWTNGVAREYTVSEVGLAFCLAAENKRSGENFNQTLIDQISLPPGYKAIQVAQVSEGFNPAQGYVMSAPSSTVAMSYISRLRMVTSQGEVSVQHSTDWGRMNSSVAHLLYVSGKSPTPIQSSRASEGDWWVGWGGSGGRWMYHSSYQRQVYSRGYFFVPSEDDTVTITCPHNVGGSSNVLTVAVGNQRNGDFQGKKLILQVPENFEIPVPEEPINLKDHPTWQSRYVKAKENRFVDPEVIDPSDVVRTWVVRHGDHRLSYLREREGWSMDPNKRLFVPHPDWDPEGDNADASRSVKQIHSFVQAGGAPESDSTFHRGLVRGVNYAPEVRPDFTIDPDTNDDFEANRPPSYPYSLEPTETRDWTTGTGIAPDGAYWGKVDDVAHVYDGSIPPYFSKKVWDGVSPDQFDETNAPNQAVPSAVMFGSIPSAASAGLQWTTLLFRPDITPGGHLGARDHGITGDTQGAPPDHTILDWFWMPVVQPFAVSERFSTAGKINMNYRIAPFSYVKRATGLHAVFKSERLLAIPTDAGQTYKDYRSASSNTGWRHRIDSAETLEQFESKFDQGDVFKTESEICEQFLIPEGETLATVKGFWDQHLLTGDNVLERPYANLYPRLTTRSNVYRVHVMAQTLRKSRDSDPTKFDPELDTFVGEYRGETVVERSIDPNDPEIPDYAKNPGSDLPRLDQFYTYRILYNRRFAP